MKHKIFTLLCILLMLFHGCSHKKNIPHQSIPEKKMVVIIPSYNNEQWYKKNLSSVFEQHYTNYRVIYIDDCSSDCTYENVQKWINEFNQQDCITLIHNAQRKGSLANMYHAIHSCDDNEVIVQLDGDDWFAHRDVLKHLNKLYQTQNIRATYGSFKNWPGGRRGFCKPICSNRSIRDMQTFPAGALRTFYARLFKHIKKDDLIDARTNTFFQTAGDVAYMIPILEMVGDKFCYVPEILCIRNTKTPINDYKVNAAEQARVTQEICNKKEYGRMKKPS